MEEEEDEEEGEEEEEEVEGKETCTSVERRH